MSNTPIEGMSAELLKTNILPAVQFLGTLQELHDGGIALPLYLHQAVDRFYVTRKGEKSKTFAGWLETETIVVSEPERLPAGVHALVRHAACAALREDPADVIALLALLLAERGLQPALPAEDFETFALSADARALAEAQHAQMAYFQLSDIIETSMEFKADEAA